MRLQIGYTKAAFRFAVRVSYVAGLYASQRKLVSAKLTFAFIGHYAQGRRPGIT